MILSPVPGGSQAAEWGIHPRYLKRGFPQYPVQTGNGVASAEVWTTGSRKNSNLYVHTLYSDFKDYGRRYEYVPATNDSGIPGTISPALPRKHVILTSSGELIARGNHTFGTALITGSSRLVALAC